MKKSITIWSAVLVAAFLLAFLAYSENLKKPKKTFVESPNLFSTPLVVKEWVFEFTGAKWEDVTLWARNNVKVEEKRYRANISREKKSKPGSVMILHGGFDSNGNPKPPIIKSNDEIRTTEEIMKEVMNPQIMKTNKIYVVDHIIYVYELTVNLPEGNLPEFATKILDYISGQVSPEDMENGKGKSIYEIFPWLPRSSCYIYTVNTKTGEIGDIRFLDVFLKKFSENRREFVFRTENYQPTSNPDLASTDSFGLQCFLYDRWPYKNSNLRIRSCLFALPHKFEHRIQIQTQKKRGWKVNYEIETN